MSPVVRVGDYVMGVLEDLREEGGDLASFAFDGTELLRVASSDEGDVPALSIAVGVGCSGLAEMHPKTILCESQLASILDHDPRTIRAMVRRREIPPPVPLGNKAIWFAGNILDFIQARMERAEQEARRRAVRTLDLIEGAN